MDNTTTPSQYYTIDDLTKIRITGVERFTNNPVFVPLKEVSDSEFERWAIKRFHQEPKPLLPDDVLEHFGKVWNYHDRVWLLNRMTEVLGRPCVQLES